MWKKTFKPKSLHGSCETTFLSRVSDGKNVRILPVSVNIAYPPLPPSDNFTLDAQLQAGVPLTQVNSMLLETSEKEVAKHLNEFVEDFDKAQQSSQA